MNPDVDFKEQDVIEIFEQKGEFEGEAFFSTDGKHTVHIKSSTPEGRKAGLEWGFKAYERIVERLGTKAQMWEKQMNGNGKPTEQAPVCNLHNKPMVYKQGTSKTTGKPYAFWACNERLADGSYCNYKPEKK